MAVLNYIAQHIYNKARVNFEYFPHTKYHSQMRLCLCQLAGLQQSFPNVIYNQNIIFYTLNMLFIVIYTPGKPEKNDCINRKKNQNMHFKIQKRKANHIYTDCAIIRECWESSLQRMLKIRRWSLLMLCQGICHLFSG